jgi:hypothetical protein
MLLSDRSGLDLSTAGDAEDIDWRGFPSSGIRNNAQKQL